MKKLFALLLCLVLFSVCGVAVADEYEPGDEFTITLAITEVDGQGAAYVHYDASACPVTCISIVEDSPSAQQFCIASPIGNVGRFGIIKADGVIVGNVGTVTFRIDSNAQPGTYTINVWGEYAAIGVTGTYTFTVK